jgi:hypothetical protein
MLIPFYFYFGSVFLFNPQVFDPQVFNGITVTYADGNTVLASMELPTTISVTSPQYPFGV